MSKLKPHLVKFKLGGFGIRKFSFFHVGWVFADAKGEKYWWPVEYAAKWAYFRTKEEAEVRLFMMTDIGERI